MEETCHEHAALTARGNTVWDGGERGSLGRHRDSCVCVCDMRVDTNLLLFKIVIKAKFLSSRIAWKRH